MAKKTIRVVAEEIRDRLDLVTLEEAIKLLTDLSVRLGPSATLDVGHADWDGVYVNVCVKRKETDTEYAYRLKQENTMKLIRDERERREYERLAAKFKKD